MSGECVGGCVCEWHMRWWGPLLVVCVLVGKL